MRMRRLHVVKIQMPQIRKNLKINWIAVTHKKDHIITAELILNVQGCDATMLNSSNSAGLHIFLLFYITLNLEQNAFYHAAVSAFSTAIVFV